MRRSRNSSRCSIANGFESQRHRLADRQDPHRRAVRAASGEASSAPSNCARSSARRTFASSVTIRRRTSTATGPTPSQAKSSTGCEAKFELAEQAGVRLFHENEHRIYGDSPERRRRSVRDRAAARPCDGRIRRRQLRLLRLSIRGRAGRCEARHDVHFHIKDWKAGEKHGSIAGEGAGADSRRHRRRRQDGLRRLRDDGAAPARRRPDRRRHRAGTVPEGGRRVQGDRR